MQLILSVPVHNARLDAIETQIGTSAILAIMSGSAPVSCAAAETGVRLATITLPSDWMSAAAAGSKAKLGTWQDSSADATGTAGYFRIYDSAGTTCGMQGDVTATAGGGALTMDSISIAAAQAVTITGFTLTD